MTTALSHRGPDADGYFEERELAIGHRRLSIIDLSESANQPLFDNSERYVIVFNGEMYNFQEVKSQIDDYQFRTNGDTEVLVAAFAKDGPDCIGRFQGMFAFALWDRQERKLFLFRDRMGVKPLYYYADNDKLLFASEIRALLASDMIKRKLNLTALKEYLSYQSIGFSSAAIEGVDQVEAGTYLVVKDGKIEKHRYWSLIDCKVDFDFGDVDAVRHEVRTLMRKSVSKRLISDVAVGAFLSGGIDSSAIVGLMAETSTSKPSTFTIAFDEAEFDESTYAELVAKKFNTQHTRIVLKPTVFLDELENGLNAMDTPSADGINTYVVSKAIRKAGITVALSGVGGDELFAGYPFFRQFLRLQRNRNLYNHTAILRAALSGVMAWSKNERMQRIRQILSAPSPSIEYSYPVSRQILTPALIRKITQFRTFGTEETSLFQELKDKGKRIGQYPFLSQVSMAEYLGYTQHTLLKDTDQMSMAVSLEVREPFFDHDLVAFVLSIPDFLKYPGYPKKLLVDSLHPLIPETIAHRKKQGFVFPWNVWMKRELKSFCEGKINRLSQRDFIEGKALMQFWKKFLHTESEVRWPEIWLFVVLEHWLEKNHIDS